MKLRAVINADDLGGSAEVNDRIFELMIGRWVTSATILANGPNVDSALRRAQDFPEHSFGVHLNISEFTPLRADPALTPLLGDDGRFKRNQARRVPLSSGTVRAIAREFDRQVSKVRDSGIVISHLDSHHHVHTIPALFFALKFVQRRHSIGSVRITRNLEEKRQKPALRLKKALWNGAVRHVGRTRTTMLLTDLQTFVRAAPLIRRPSTAELMVHPGNPDYAEEERLLTSEWWSELPMEVELISYNQV